MPEDLPADAADATGPSWTSWASKQRIAAGLDHWRWLLCKRPLHVITACSGTDGPIVALKELVGDHNLCHIASCDSWDISEQFIRLNHSPRHFFKDIQAFLAPQAVCSICQGSEDQGLCNMMPADLFIAGFPCKLFSGCNPKRWARSAALCLGSRAPAILRSRISRCCHVDWAAEIPKSTFRSSPRSVAMRLLRFPCAIRETFQGAASLWSHPDAKPFLAISAWRRSAPSPPSVVVLENSAGLDKAGENLESPIDFVLRGCLGEESVGLETNERYTTRVFKLSAVSQGLPHQRQRVWIIMVAKTVPRHDRVFATMVNLLEKLSTWADPGHIKDFLCRDFDQSMVVQRPGASASAGGMRASSLMKSVSFRRSHVLPMRDSVAGRP